MISSETRTRHKSIFPGLKVFSIAISLFLTGCLPEKAERDIGFSGQYFDIRSMIENDIKILHEKNAVLSKTLIVGTERSTETVDSVNWEQEFKLFLDSDINKPALVNGYNNDTSVTDSGYSVTYTAIDSSSFTRKLTVTFDEAGPVHLSIINRKETMYYTASEELEYHSGRSVLVKVRNKVVTGDVVSFRIEGVISMTD